MQDYHLDEAGRLICRFHGMLDTNIALIIADDLKKHHVDEVSMVTFDMKDVDFICSGFIRLIILTAKKTGKDNFALKHVQPPVARVLKIAGIDELISF